MKLYLLRHGESAGNASGVFAVHALNPPLTDAGVAQATAQAKSLSRSGLSAIYASPLLRTRQTASIVSEHCGLPVVYSEALWEVDVGDLDGGPVDADSLATYLGVIGEWDQGDASAAFPGGETLDSVTARFKGFLDGLSGRNGGPTLVVGHGVLFMAVLWVFCDNAEPTMIENYMGRGHLSILSGQDGRYRVTAFNLAPPGIGPASAKA